MIRATLAAVSQPDVRSGFDPVLEQLQQNGWGVLVAAIRRVLEGERKPEELLAGLDEEDSLIIAAVLAGLKDSQHRTNPDR